MTGADEERVSAYEQMGIIYDAYLARFVAELGAPTVEKESDPDVADDLYFEAIRLAAWQRDFGWMYLAIVHHDKEAPVVVACGFRERRA
jgi:hypothetical protein